MKGVRLLRNIKCKSYILFLIVFVVVCLLFFFKYVYAVNSIEDIISNVSIEYLLEAEQVVLEDYSIKSEVITEAPPEFNKTDESLITSVENVGVVSFEDLKVTEYLEEYRVDNRLAVRNIEEQVGNSSESDNVKYFRIFGEDGINKRGRCEYYAGGPEEAESEMESFKVQVWSLDSNNEWYVRSVYLQAHKNIVKTMKCIFSDLLALPPEERTPIKTIGCYNYRAGSSCHTCGVAIDINWEENAEMTNSGIVTAGYYWKPYEDVYSIAPDSKMVEIFKQYGFGWGGEWTSKKDYMHFSYFDR